MYCRSCGAELPPNSNFCKACGSPTQGQTPPPQSQNPYQRHVCQKLCDMEHISAIIWGVIAVVQLLVGISIGKGFILAVGAWNIFAVYLTLQDAAAALQPSLDLVQKYKDSLSGLLGAMAWNLIAGGVIGVIGSIYEFRIRQFVLSNATLFNAEAARLQQQQTGDHL